MKKMFLLSLLLLSVLLAGIGSYLLIFQHQDPISRRTFDQLRLGMTETSVESIIGLAPGDYYTGSRGIGGGASRGPWGFTLIELGLAEGKIPLDWYSENGRGKVRRWWGNKYAIEVAFGPDRTAVGIYFVEIVKLDTD
jgi:hypothetical protein